MNVFQRSHDCSRGGDGTPILGLGMVGRLWADDPHFEVFNPTGSHFYASSNSDWPSLSAEKIVLSLSHLVPEIFGPKVGLIFHHNVLFNHF